MKFNRIYLKNFRNHSEYEITPHPYMNIFIGGNGQGKTSILEALSLGLKGGSFRVGKNWVQRGFEEATIFLEFETEYGKGEIRTNITREGQVRTSFNGKRTKIFPFQNFGVFFTPNDLYSIRGEALYRRKLVDELVLQKKPSVYQSFNRILGQKNRFLKLCKQGRYGEADQKVLLNSLQEAFIQAAENLIQERFCVIDEIIPFWKKEGKTLLQTEDFGIQYLCQKKKPAPTYKQAVEFLKQEVKEKEVVEKLRGCSLVGPQRDDLQFLYKQQEAREGLSQGQQKALLLSWKIAQWKQCFERNKPSLPPLFFDDVFLEIDQHYQKNLLEFFLENQAQSFITIPSWNHHHLPEAKRSFFDLGPREDYDRQQRANAESNEVL